MQRAPAGRDAHLDTLSLILTPEHDLLDRLDPFVSTRFTVGAEVPPLMVRRDFEMVSIMRRGFDSDAVVQVDMTIWEVGVGRRGVPTQDTVFEDEPVLVVPPRFASD